MNDYTPAVLLPKVRSTFITESAKLMPCTSRVSLFMPGFSCSPQDTNVWTHFDSIGKGTSTKSCDLFGCASCFNCHEIIDMRNLKAWEYVTTKYPGAYAERLRLAMQESIGRLLEMEIITVKGGVLI